MKKIDIREGRDVEIALDKGEKIRIILEDDGGFFIAPMAGLFSFENGDVYVTENLQGVSSERNTNDKETCEGT